MDRWEVYKVPVPVRTNLLLYLAKCRLSVFGGTSCPQTVQVTIFRSAGSCNDWKISYSVNLGRSVSAIMGPVLSLLLPPLAVGGETDEENDAAAASAADGVAAVLRFLGGERSALRDALLVMVRRPPLSVVFSSLWSRSMCFSSVVAKAYSEPHSGHANRRRPREGPRPPRSSGSAGPGTAACGNGSAPSARGAAELRSADEAGELPAGCASFRGRSADFLAGVEHGDNGGLCPAPLPDVGIPPRGDRIIGGGGEDRVLRSGEDIGE